MKQENVKQSKYNSPVKAMLTGITDLFRRPENTLKLNEDDRLEHKKVLITGASSGLGFATAVELARRGAHVIMAMRSGIPDKGEEVKVRSGSGKLDMIALDLLELNKLREFARELRRRFGQIDILICNAAIVTGKSRVTGHGLDEMFVVNYFSKFLLINYFLEEDCIHTSGNTQQRIVIVTSESHRNPENIDWESFGKYIPYGRNKSVAMYGYYKLLLVTLVNELSRRLTNSCAVYSLCPGPVNSKIAREAPGMVQPMLKLLFRIFFRSPEKACKPVIYLATSREIEGQTGKYLFLMEEKPMDGKAMDLENGKKLWELSEELRQRIGL